MLSNQLWSCLFLVKTCLDLHRIQLQEELHICGLSKPPYSILQSCFILEKYSLTEVMDTNDVRDGDQSYNQHVSLSLRCEIRLT